MTDATTSPAKQTVVVHAVHGAEEMQVCVDLQRRVWGYTELDTVPDQIFIVAAKTGGHVLVACDHDEPVGFALAFAAFRNNRTYLHSHMVAVLDAYQNRGVGRLLKLAQRDDAIARGIDLIEWTFDPLQIKNARFNIARLGAIVRNYIPNLYGRTSSRLHAGLPTDRLVAEWWVGSPRVTNIIRSDGLSGAKGSDPQCVAVSIPANIRDLCQADPQAAGEIQSRIRKEFSTHFANGFAAVDFAVDQHHGSYLLEPYED